MMRFLQRLLRRRPRELQPTLHTEAAAQMRQDEDMDEIKERIERITRELSMRDRRRRLRAEGS